MRWLDYPHTDALIGAHERLREELEPTIETGPSMREALQVSRCDFPFTRLEPRVPGIDRKLEAPALESESG